MSEDPGERATAYLKKIEAALKLTQSANNDGALQVLDYVKRYVSDCKYYLQAGKPTTALASVAYAEGLLDSLNILGFTHSRERDS